MDQKNWRLKLKEEIETRNSMYISNISKDLVSKIYIKQVELYVEIERTINLTLNFTLFLSNSCNPRIKGEILTQIRCEVYIEDS